MSRVAALLQRNAFHLGGFASQRVHFPALFPTMGRYSCLVNALTIMVASLASAAEAPPAWDINVNADIARVETIPGQSTSFRVAFADKSPRGVWDVILASPNYHVSPGATLELSFRARSQRAARPILVAVTQAKAPYANVGLLREIELTPQWRDVTEVFKTSDHSGPFHVAFALGQGADDVEILDVRLRDPSAPSANLVAGAAADRWIAASARRQVERQSKTRYDQSGVVDTRPTEQIRSRSKYAWSIFAAQLAFLALLAIARRVFPVSAQVAEATEGGELGDEPRGRRIARDFLTMAQYAIFPLFYVGFIVMVAFDLNIVLVLGSLLMSVGLEFLLPYRPEWNKIGRQEGNDFLHLLIGTIGGSTLGQVVAFYSALRFIMAHPWIADGRLWPTTLPFPLQVVLAVVLYESTAWTAHFLGHHVGWMWACHRLHHSCERITVTKGFRRSIQEGIFDGMCSLTLMSVVGMPIDVTVWLGGFQLSGTIFAHANIAMRVPGFFERIFITPAAHRIHHAIDLRLGNTNFGNTLMIFDVLFGYYSDTKTNDHGPLGVKDNTVPVGFLKQCLSPLMWEKLDQDPVKYAGGK